MSLLWMFSRSDCFWSSAVFPGLEARTKLEKREAEVEDLEGKESEAEEEE